MKRRNFVIGIIALSTLSLMANPLTPEEALARLGRGHKLSGGKSVSASPRLVHTGYTTSGEASTYLFSNADEKGFILLSADDQAYPLLGYSDEGSFDSNTIPDNMLWWISQYGRQIEYARSKNIENTAKVPEFLAEWEPIAPMVTSKWNQDAPFNDQCPLKNGQATYTGCVATAMAQIMNYFKYPEVGEGSIQYTPSSLGRKLSLLFSRQEFDWDNMLDVYSRGGYTETESQAVAYLMKACGYSVRMNYNTTASGTQGSLVAYAAKTYFKYDQNARCEYRDIYSTSVWTEMVYDNLKNVGPMVMNGQAPDGGHSFVCDGYDGNGYFHFNWGWGGSSDGYFTLDALSPAGIGIGGYEGGFNYNQDAIFGMQPPTGEPPVTYYGNLFLYGYAKGSISGNTVTITSAGAEVSGWGNVGCDNVSVNIGAKIEPLSGGESRIVTAKLGDASTVSVNAGTYLLGSHIKFNVILPDLEDGAYRVTIMTQDSNVADAPWQPIQVTWSYPNCVDVNVKDGLYSLENVAIPSVTIRDVELLSTLYAGKYVRIKGLITNPNDIELTRAVAAGLFDEDKECLTGSANVMTFESGEEAEYEWLTRFTLVNGYSLTSEKELTLKLYDSNTGVEYGDFGKVLVKPMPTSGSPMLTGAKFNNSTGSIEYEINGQTFRNVAQLPNDEIDASISYKINKGFFDGKITASIYKPDPNVSNILIPVVENFYEDQPLLERNETVAIDLKYDFKDCNKETLYFLVIRYANGVNYSSLTQLPFMTQTSGVDNVWSDSDDIESEYYNLQGLRISDPEPGQLVIERRGSNSRKVIFK